MFYNIGPSRRFWSKLPQTLCGDATQGSNEQSCWNGRDAGFYAATVAGDGLAAQVLSKKSQTEGEKMTSGACGHISQWAQYSRAGNTKGGSITVPLTSCLTGLD